MYPFENKKWYSKFSGHVECYKMETQLSCYSWLNLTGSHIRTLGDCHQLPQASDIA